MYVFILTSDSVRIEGECIDETAYYSKVYFKIELLSVLFLGERLSEAARGFYLTCFVCYLLFAFPFVSLTI